MKKPVALIILDGVGIAPESPGNAVTLAKTPNLDKWKKEFPTRQIFAHGEYVGLPEGQMGNSEVGHLNIGAGRIVHQSLSLINKEITENKLKDNKILLETIEHAKKNNSKVNIFGLVSPGGVHSHYDHIIALYNIIKNYNVKVVIHAFTDGRDVAPMSSKEDISYLEDKGIEVVSISGRYYAMDRDKRWERTQLAFATIIGKTQNIYQNSMDYIQSNFDKGITDEFLIPARKDVSEDNFVKNNDAILFANFRPDRARQLSHMFIGSNEKITHYDYEPKIKFNNLYFATLMEYTGINSHIMFPPTKMKNLLGDVLESNGFIQMRAAETEKYPHVTFFFDGGEDIERKTEKRILVHSPKVATYDLKPEMSSVELTDEIIKNSNGIDVFIINYAQADMVGHSGKIPAVVKAVEAADIALGRLYEKIIKELGGVMLITADHGNAERMLDEDNNPVTKHTTNPVQVILTSNNYSFNDKIGKLADLAPTILKILNVNIPKEMTGEPLIK